MPTHIHTLIDIMKRKKKKRKEKKKKNTVGKNISQHWRIKEYNQETCKNDDVLLYVCKTGLLTTFKRACSL